MMGICKQVTAMEGGFVVIAVKGGLYQYPTPRRTTTLLTRCSQQTRGTIQRYRGPNIGIRQVFLVWRSKVLQMLSRTSGTVELYAFTLGGTPRSWQGRKCRRLATAVPAFATSDATSFPIPKPSVTKSLMVFKLSTSG